MKRLFGFLIFTGGYGLAWWGYECLSGRVAGTPESNGFLPPLKDLFIPGRLAPDKLGAPTKKTGGKLNLPTSTAQKVTGGNMTNNVYNTLFNTGALGETLAFGPNLIKKLFG